MSRALTLRSAMQFMTYMMPSMIAPCNVATQRGDQQLAHSLLALCHSQSGSEGNAQHHDQPEQNFAHPAGRVEVSLNKVSLLGWSVMAGLLKR